MKVYHYTTKDGAEGIMKSKVIRQSTNTSTDAMMGSGVYLTDMSPQSNSKEDIALNNYGDASRAAHADYAIELDIPEDRLKKFKGGRKIWFFEGTDLGIENYTYKVIEHGKEESSVMSVLGKIAIGVGIAALAFAAFSLIGNKKEEEEEEEEEEEKRK